MKSRINGKEIPSDELWVWDVHNAMKAGEYLPPHKWDGTSSRQPDGCSFGCDVQELFELKDPLGTGCYYFCHNHMMLLKKLLPRKNRDNWCPVCGFSENSSGPDGNGCAFGHLWEEKRITKQVPKKSRRSDMDDKSCKKCGLPNHICVCKIIKTHRKWEKVTKDR